ncbi:hypothetical protein ABFY59_29950 [Priestia aryabhattai]|uniref:hypothetical protein n=1 Tax=Priestia aryabhattai TaxID=412384 RepID=UPI003D2C8DEC
MNNQLRETNNISLPQLENKDKKSFHAFLIDVLVFVILLTVLTYYLAYTYKRGFLGYYGIDRLMLHNIGYYYIPISFKQIFNYGGILGGSYVFLSFLPYVFKSIGIKNLTKIDALLKLVKGVLFLLVLPIIAIMMLFEREEFIWSCFLLVAFFCLIFLIVAKQPINYSVCSTFGNSLISTFKKNKLVTFVAIIIYVLILPCFFASMGKIDAASKSRYLVVESKTMPLVIIAQTQDKLLVAPVDIKKRLISPIYMIIESKSTVNKPLNFIGGLTVKKVEN